MQLPPLPENRTQYNLDLILNYYSHYGAVTEVITYTNRSSHNLEEIGERLRNFLLAEHLKEMSTTPVLVTNTGLSLEYD